MNEFHVSYSICILNPHIPPSRSTLSGQGSPLRGEEGEKKQTCAGGILAGEAVLEDLRLERAPAPQSRVDIQMCGHPTRWRVSTLD